MCIAAYTETCKWICWFDCRSLLWLWHQSERSPWQHHGRPTGWSLVHEGLTAGGWQREWSWHLYNTHLLSDTCGGTLALSNPLPPPLHTTHTPAHTHAHTHTHTPILFLLLHENQNWMSTESGERVWPRFKALGLGLIPLRLLLLFKSCGLWTLPLTINETLEWLSSLPICMQESFWWWRRSNRYSFYSPPASWGLVSCQCLFRDRSVLNMFNQNQHSLHLGHLLTLMNTNFRWASLGVKTKDGELHPVST